MNLRVAAVLLVLGILASAVFGATNQEPSSSTSSTTVVRGVDDLFSTLLEKCPAENRRAFLGSVKFLGRRVVSFDYKSIEACLGDLKMKAVSDRLALVGDEGADAQDRGNADRFGELFLACPTGVRNEFFDTLTFHEGRLDGMFVKNVVKCSDESDLALFSDLFGKKGVAFKDWHRDCRCDASDSCHPQSGYYCRPKRSSQPGR